LQAVLCEASTPFSDHPAKVGVVRNPRAFTLGRMSTVEITETINRDAKVFISSLLANQRIRRSIPGIVS